MLALKESPPIDSPVKMSQFRAEINRFAITISGGGAGCQSSSMTCSLHFDTLSWHRELYLIDVCLSSTSTK